MLFDQGIYFHILIETGKRETGAKPVRDRRRKGTVPASKRHCGYTREDEAGALTPKPEDLPCGDAAGRAGTRGGRTKRLRGKNQGAPFFRTLCLTGPFS